MKIRKAVIPAAGLGIRVLPVTKSMPKEMLPIIDKPAIQYIVEEAADAGITDILIITNRGKNIIQDHFDKSVELESVLTRGGKHKELEIIRRISQLCNIHYIRQKEAKGLGHAVLCAKSFIGNEPFAVMYGDGVIISETPAIKQLIDVYGEFGEGVVGIKAVPENDISRYGSVKIEQIRDNIFKCTDMLEKPKALSDALSLYAIMDRCILPPRIFNLLETTLPGANGEIQLTDAMRQIAADKGMTAVNFEGVRYDMGNKFGILKANIELGLKHPEIKESLKEYFQTNEFKSLLQ